MTPPSDFERLAERIGTVYGDAISDRETFNYYYGKYLKGEDNGIFLQKNRNKVFDFYAENFGIQKDSLFKKAGGKSFERDKAQTAGTVVDSQKDYARKGASRVDLRGYDTISTKRFPYFGKVRGRIVKARQIEIVFFKKKVVRYIDERGRYVSRRASQH